MDKKNWTPDSMFNKLRKSIIGQDSYLKDLCSCIWLQNQRREYFLETGEGLSQPKFNMLVLGKSGMGKTSSVKAVASLLDMPVIIEDASEFRGAGWKGRQITEIIGDIVKLVESDYKQYKSSAGYSIVVLDEIDKIFMGKNQNMDSFSPASNLLKFIEGTKVSFTDGNQKTTMRTDNLLFICIGAFDGLENIIKKRMHPKAMGFTVVEQEQEEKNILSNVSTEDLKEYGMSEQLLGRLPFVSVMNELDIPDYKKILLESDISPIKHLNKLLINRQGVELSITDTAAEQLAETVIEKNLGARGLQTEMIGLLKDTIYQMPDDGNTKEYRLEYDNGFKIGSYSGARRITANKQAGSAYELSKVDVSRLQLTLDVAKDDVKSVGLYAETVFETVENNIQFLKHKSISDDMNYQDIVNAKYILSACVTQVIIDADDNGAKRTMMQLLHSIMTFDTHKRNEYLHRLSANYEQFSRRICYLSDEKIEELKRKTWNIVKEYSLQHYDLEKEDEEDLFFQ